MKFFFVQYGYSRWDFLIHLKFLVYSDKKNSVRQPPRRTVVGQSAWCIAKLCTLSSAVMSSAPRACARVCEERLRLAYRKVARYRTRAGIISPPRANRIPLPSPLIPLNKFTAFWAFAHSYNVTPSFYRSDISGLWNESPVAFHLSWSFAHGRKGIFYKSLLPSHTYVYDDLWSGSVSYFIVPLF